MNKMVIIIVLSICLLFPRYVPEGEFGVCADGAGSGCFGDPPL